jgi:flavin reductase (DIM6/NTAB) family NADH-FMN oxidoreductase RutF
VRLQEGDKANTIAALRAFIMSGEREVCMSIDKTLFRQVAGSFATGVTVITTGFEGSYHGMTASAFASLSLEPTTILVCIDRSTHTLTILQECGCFNVNILSAAQENLSRIFASKDAPERHGLQGIDFTVSDLGVPLLRDALAYLECRVIQQYDGGDHVIVVGEVENAGTNDGPDPLLYFRSHYRGLAPEA